MNRQNLSNSTSNLKIQNSKLTKQQHLKLNDIGKLESIISSAYDTCPSSPDVDHTLLSNSKKSSKKNSLTLSDSNSNSNGESINTQQQQQQHQQQMPLRILNGYLSHKIFIFCVH